MQRLAIALAATTFFTVPAYAQKVAYIGDTGHSAAAFTVANFIKSQNPDHVGGLGDRCYNDSPTYAEQQQKYEPLYSQGKVTNALGNHEYNDLCGNEAKNALAFLNQPGNERYFKKSISANLDLFVVNSYEPGGGTKSGGSTANSPQAMLVKQWLAESKAPHRVVIFHHTAHSSGSHGSNPYMQAWNFCAMGATAVIAGHDHHAEHVKVPCAKLPGGFLPYFTSGLGGRERDIIKATKVPGSVFAYNSDYAVLFATYSPTSVKYEFKTVKGQVVHSATYNVSGTAPEPTQTCPDGTVIPVGDVCPVVEPPDPPDPEPPAPTNESPSGATLTSTSGQIVNSLGQVWTLRPGTDWVGLAPFLNGVRAGSYVGQTTLLLYWEKKTYRQNANGVWQIWVGHSRTWSASADPRPVLEPKPCPDGTTVPGDQECPPPPPPPPVECPDGTTVPAGQECPLPPPPPPPPPNTTGLPIKLNKSGQELSGRAIKATPGQTLIWFEGPTTGIRVRDITTDGGYTVLVNRHGSIATDLLVENVRSVNVNRECLKSYGSLINTTFRGLDCKMDNTPPWDMSDLPEGIAIHGPHKGLRIENSRFDGFKMLDRAGYDNGDGLATEWPTPMAQGGDDITLSNVVSVNNTDAGFDIKTVKVRGHNLYAANNYRDFRFWGPDIVITGDMYCGDARNACIWANGRPAGTAPQIINIEKLTVRFSKALGANGAILLGDGDIRPIFNIAACDFEGPPGTVIKLKISPQSKLGPGCNVVKPFTAHLPEPQVLTSLPPAPVPVITPERG